MRAMAAPDWLEDRMPRAYSQDLRERVLDAARQGYMYGAVAARLAVGESTVRGWFHRERLSGRRTPGPHPGGHSKVGMARAESRRILTDGRN